MMELMKGMHLEILMVHVWAELMVKLLDWMLVGTMVLKLEIHLVVLQVSLELLIFLCLVIELEGQMAGE